MSKARNIAMTASMVVLWVVVIWAVLSLLMGCEGLQERDKREGAFRVNADCEKDQVSVEFELDQHADDRKINVKGAP